VASRLSDRPQRLLAIRPIIPGDITGRTCTRLSPEVIFLHLCLHIFNHGIFNTRITSYFDLVMLIRKYGSTMHWDQIDQLASEWGMRNIVYWVAQVLQRDFHISLLVEFPPKSRKTSLQYRTIQSSFKNMQSSPPSEITIWLSAFLLRLYLIDNPSILPKLLLTSLFPNPTLRQSIHNHPTSLLHHWQTYTNRILQSLITKPQNKSISEDKFRL